VWLDRTSWTCAQLGGPSQSSLQQGCKAFQSRQGISQLSPHHLRIPSRFWEDCPIMRTGHVFSKNEAAGILSAPPQTVLQISRHEAPALSPPSAKLLCLFLGRASRLESGVLKGHDLRTRLTCGIPSACLLCVKSQSQWS
jgi:hypothetical protein